MAVDKIGGGGKYEICEAFFWVTHIEFYITLYIVYVYDFIYIMCLTLSRVKET